ncbi:MAG: thymidylate synthase (FAD), partial [Firmicutes bacterium]|nr:thymidylate synthase (FAD) [Bacillota bacterium]
NACETKIVVTMNARSLYNFLTVRLCTRAQWEIRKMAELIRAELIKVSPLLFELTGPICEREGYCPEGKFSCGRYPVKERKRRVFRGTN